MRSNTVAQGNAAGAGLWQGVLLIALSGFALGAVYNAFGLAADRPWGLAWTAGDRLDALPSIEELASPPVDSYTTDIDDPLAIPSGAAFAGLPEIPAVGRPFKVKIDTLRRYFDARAAVIVDARAPDEYDVGHIPGALNLPHDLVVSDPTLVQQVVADGKPIIAYCGGEGCEVSLMVAEEFSLAGFERVAVYVGGFPEWEAAGNPVQQGAGAGGGTAWAP